MRVPRLGFTLLLAAGIVFGVRPSVASEDYSNRIGITLGGGAYKLVGGALDHTRIGPWSQAGLRWGWRRQVDIEGTYRYGFNWDDTQHYRCRTTGVDMDVLWNYKPDAKWTPQAFLGTGVFWFNVQDFTGVPSPGLFDSGRDVFGFKDDGFGSPLNGQNFKLFGGLGLEYFVTPRLSIRGIARIDYLFDQHIDNSGASDSLGAAADDTGRLLAKAKANVDANDWVPAFAINLTWFFGERDADGDGIPNRLDACPDEAEDLDGFQDADGCPDPDNDGDEILDVQDTCPDEAEDLDGFQDEDGCPDPDNDGDGILDAQDRCPDEAEDLDGFQDEDGCPDFDNDGDAVPDSLDQCPDTPAGARVDETGCPVSAMEQELFDTGSIRLTNVHFASGKAEIGPDTQQLLDQVGEVLMKFPGLEVEIGGHTDSSGSDEMNRQLSEQRADAVLKYLRVKFPSLDTTQYTTFGYGESQPVADNSTPEGKAENRRVEFKALNLDQFKGPEKSQ